MIIKRMKAKKKIDLIHAPNVNKLTFAKMDAEAGLKKSLKLSPEDVIEKVTASGLRGRGGAGFPTGAKWKFCRHEENNPKYVVCNADEGEPGTFKDRLIMTDYPDLMFEGMTIAGRAIGAAKGVVYLRAEYTYLRAHLEAVLEKRRKDGLLGKNIMSEKGFNYDIEVRMGSGAYICGEETALLESLEGMRGEARNRPPYPVNCGFLNKPTIVNNVETFAWVSCILNKGAKWFNKVGTDKSTGFKIFSISGDCKRPGVYEFPFSTTMRELLDVVGGEDAKAVQVGGACGNCIPATDFDRELAYEDLSTGGSIIVFGPNRDMLKVAENFLEFFSEESCGQCTPCRIGNVKLLEGARKMAEGKAGPDVFEDMRQLAKTMQLSSKCGLGQSSPNAFLSIMENFKDEIMERQPVG